MPVFSCPSGLQEAEVTVDGVGLRIHPEVIEALESDTPVVALESTIISHGLPRPDNLRVAREIEQTVRDTAACRPPSR